MRRLPLALTPLAEAGAWEPVEAPSRAVAEAAGCLILLVDDSPTNRLVLSRQLLRAGYQADVVEDGRSALEAMDRHRYGLVLTDVQIPGMDGYQLAAEIRKLQWGAGGIRIPILAITANEMEGELERCLAAGMDDCLLKPVSIPDLDAMLRKWLPGAVDLMKAVGTGTGEGGDPTPVLETDAPVNLEFLSRWSRGDAAAALEILREFRDATRHDIAELRAAQSAGALVKVMRWAHRIKGSSLMVGAKGLAEAAEALERAARSVEARKLESFILSIEAAYVSVDRFTDGQMEKPPES